VWNPKYLAQLHPLLHTNTSTLGQQSYSSIFTGEEFFLKDHQLATNDHAAQTVLPGAVYLEMARAAIAEAASIAQGSSIVELQDTVWACPMVVAGNKQVTIALFASDNGEINYEIYSGEVGQEVIHCQGRASVSDRSAAAPLDIEELQAQMQQGKLGQDSVYAEFVKLGIHYGPAQQTITAVHQGEKQLLARLSSSAIPAMSAADGRYSDYVLHPSLMTGALQAGLRLIADRTQYAGIPLFAHMLERLHMLLPCPEEMFAWVRYSQDRLPEDKLANLDIDLIDTKGNVCVQMRGLSFQADNAAIDNAAQATWLFSTEQSSVAGNGASHNGSQGAPEKMELFLKQEIALLLRKPIEDIPADQNYFELGLPSLGIAHLVQKTSALLDENLSPSALFEYQDIQSVAAYLAITYPTKIDSLSAVRRKNGHTHSGAQRQMHVANLTPLPRKKYFSNRLATPSQGHINTTLSSIDVSGEQLLEAVLWPEESLDDSYEKVTF
jgi:hypothetical protein